MYRGRRQRRGHRGRHPKPIRLDETPSVDEFLPVPSSESAPIELNSAELEALRLVDLRDLSQEEAGRRMGVSRGTVWRLLHSARRKVTQALTEARPLTIVHEYDRTTG